MNEKYILGIDQGGTKTAAAVMRSDGFIVGRATARGAYFPTEGIEKALDPMQEAAEEALRSAAVDRESIGLTVAGVTGLDWPGEDLLVKQALQERLLLNEVFACNDAVAALYSGTMSSHGAVICAGTGLNGVLIDREGSMFVYGDYMEERAQGGSALALRAARKVFDAELGLCPPTELKNLFLKQAEAADVDALLKRYMTEKAFRYELRFLVPQILMIAREGDEVASGLISEFGGEIVDYLEAGFRKMKMKPEEEEVVLAGSVFKGEENPLTSRVKEGIFERLPGAKVVQACYEPVVGTCIMGLIRLYGDPADRAKNIRESASVLGLLRS